MKDPEATGRKISLDEESDRKMGSSGNDTMEVPIRQTSRLLSFTPSLHKFPES